MGYRHYLYGVDRALADEIHKCKTSREFADLVKIAVPDAVEKDLDGTEYVKLYDIGETVFEFGKYYENADEMYKHGDSLFSSDELNREYSDYGPIIIGRSGLECAIDWNRKHVTEIYEDLLRETSNNGWDTRSQLDRLINHAKDYLYWWQTNPADMNLEHDHIVRSWLYEHEYFELVRIYKTFDFEHKAMMFMGW